MPDDKDFLANAKPVQAQPAQAGQDFLGSATPATPPDTRNVLQRGFDQSTAVTPGMSKPAQFFAGAGSAAYPVFHPMEAAKQAWSNFTTPIVGEKAYEARQAAQPKMPAAYQAGQAVTGAMAGQAGAEALGAAGRAFRPYESPALPPGTRAYQRFAQTIGPTGQAEGARALPGLTEDVMARHPDIAQFARESNIPLKTPEEYGLAARGHAEQLNSRFYNELQQPFSQDRIHVSPEVAAYKTPGAVQPLGPYPTVAELSEALKATNQIAGRGYQAGANAFDQAQVMAAENTARQIRQTLNEHLSAKSNLSPEEVSTFRQRGGQTGNIAANAAARAQENRMAQGKSPLEAESVKGFLLRSGQSLFGGPEAMANRGFRSALRNLPQGTPTPLPEVQTGAPGGAIPPPTFSPKATTAGPEPLSPPPIRAARQFNPRTGKYE